MGVRACVYTHTLTFEGEKEGRERERERESNLGVFSNVVLEICIIQEKL